LCTCEIKISTTQFSNFHPILATTSATVNQKINNPIPQFPSNLATTSATVNQHINNPILQFPFQFHNQLIITYNGSLTPFMAGSNHLNKATN
jgi:hypothetical protein